MDRPVDHSTHLYRCGPADLPAAAGVVEPPYERPQELNASGEHFTEVGQQNQEYRYAEYRVHDGDQPAGVGRRRDVTVPWNVGRKSSQ